MTYGVKQAAKLTDASIWEGSQEYKSICRLIGKNRNSLLKKFKDASTHTSFDGQPKFVTFAQARTALEDLLPGIDDTKLASILSVG